MTLQIGDKMNKNKEKVPKIRFPGFTEPWEQRKVGEFLTESKIKGSDGSKAKKLTVKLWRKGIVPKEEIYQGSSATQYYVRKSGQFMYGKLDFLNQAFGIVPPELDGYESTLDSPAFDFKDGINSGFFLEYISLKRFYKYQGNTANGSRKAKRIHADTFFEMPISVPRHDEQKKIGSFFQNIDNLITLHQRKLNHLKDKKKGLLQKMFPKKGELVPELRFPEFTAPWEQRKLGDMCDEFKSGSSILAKDICEQGEYPVYGGNGLRGYTATYNHDGIYALIGRQGARCGNMNKVYGKAYFTEHAVAVKANKNNNTDFLFFLLDKMNLRQYSGQSAQPGLAVNKLIELITLVPNCSEQKLIGIFFNKLDNLITLHQRKLDHLKEQKKALLQQMFI